MAPNQRMTQGEFGEFAAVRLQEILDLLKRKGREYSRQEAFTNFEEGARLHSLSPRKYLMILATKHWQNLCREPEGDIIERASDVIIYLLLLQAMSVQDNPSPPTAPTSDA